MPYFHYDHNELFAEGVKLKDIAHEFGTPCYVYSRAALQKNWQTFNEAFENMPHRICYAVKANSNIAILNILARLQSGFDIVSIGELERVLAAGGDPKKIVFSGVGKKPAEILRALEVGIYCFNVESVVELALLNTLAKQVNKVANIALRVNPNIDAHTHPYIATGLKDNKFGIEYELTSRIARDIANMPNIKLVGIACHIGSQLTDMDPFMQAVDRILDLVSLLTADGIILEHINIGGGLGVRYQDEEPPSIETYVKALRNKLDKFPYEVILEPGRAITANAGVLLTKIEYLKHTPHKNFAIVDTAMNDLMRPALYDAWQEILPVTVNSHHQEEVYDIVGPVCESADFLGKDRRLRLQTGELLAICSAGAYGFSMSSNYNSRPRVAEVMVDQHHTYLIRERETVTSLFANEKLIP
ncbi:MAG: diaminopimelate decarboxylase [Gammaproteobacteria bacterium]|nr:diaminopimelate decarboxylase [Gammaproteobacteria bacterium]